MTAADVVLTVLTSAVTTLVVHLARYWRALLPLPRAKPLDRQVLEDIMRAARGGAKYDGTPPPAPHPPVE